MRKWSLFLGVYFVICVLAACASAPAGENTGIVSEEQPTCGPGVPYSVICRAVDGAEEGTLLLAEADSDVPAIYTLSITEDIAHLPDEPLRNGQLIHVAYRSVLETYPAQLAEVSDITIMHDGFDDRAALYLRVLEDLWTVDSGLNESGVEYIGTDLSATSLSPAEQAAVAHVFAQRHGAQGVTGTLEELTERGYITATPIVASGSGEPLDGEEVFYFHEWKNGCFFAIVEEPVEEPVQELASVTFTAHKWRSSLGAYWFSDCTARQNELGEWSDYTVGAEMIS